MDRLKFLPLLLLGCSTAEYQPIDSGTSDAPMHAHACMDDNCPLPQTKTLNIKSECPEGMLKVEGDYCPHKEEICLYNIDSNGKRLPGPGTIEKACGEFKRPTRCLSKQKIHLKFCMDLYEFPNKFDEIPRDWMNFFDVKQEAEKLGKRLCTAKEWTLAAEGPNGNPLPYGSGYHRDSSKCNIGVNPPNIDRFKARSPNDEISQELRKFLKTAKDMPECVSEYGIFQMAGNIDEIVINEGGDPCIANTTGNCISGLKGGHWVANVRNASTPMTTSHGQNFAWFETGTRLCKDIE